MRYHLTPVRMANIKNRQQQMLARMWKESISFAMMVGMQTGAAPLGNSMEVSQKIKNRTTVRPNNCTPRYLSKEYRDAVLRGAGTPMFTAALSTIA